MLIYYVKAHRISPWCTQYFYYDTQDGRLLEVRKEYTATPKGVTMKGAHKDIYKASDGKRNAGTQLG